jgi:hypothetical protein
LSSLVLSERFGPGFSRIIFLLRCDSMPRCYVHRGFFVVSLAMPGVGPIVSAYNTDALSDGTPSSWNVVAWDTNAFDTSDGAMHSATSHPSRFIATSTGYYLAQYSLIMAMGSSFFAKMTLNGESDVQGSGSGNSAGNDFATCCVLLSLAEGDYIEASYNPVNPDHPANGTTWIGATFQFVLLFTPGGGGSLTSRPMASLMASGPSGRVR